MESRIKMEGLIELRAALKQAGDVEAPKQMGIAAHQVGKVLAGAVKREMPVQVGKMKGSVRATTGGTGRGAGGVAAGAGVPHFMVQEYGGSIPRSGSRRKTRMKPYRGPRPGAPWWDDEGVGYHMNPAARAATPQAVAEFESAVDTIARRTFPLPA